MEVLSETKILKFHPNTLQAVRKLYDLDKVGQMDEAIDILLMWLNQQNYIVKKDFSREFLERIIITTKGSVERAKSRLDKSCTLRTLVPKLFGNYDVRNYFKHVHDNVGTVIAMPKLTPDHHRLIILPLNGSFKTSECLLNYQRYLVLFMEYLRRYEYATGAILILDLRQFDMLSVTKQLYSMEFKHFFTVVDCFGVRMKSIHIITESKVFDTIQMVLKQVLRAKIFERMYVHKYVELLHEIVPKEILPAELGGEDRLSKDIHEDWLEALSSEEHTLHMNKMNSAGTDESLRSTATFNEQYMGMPGTFRVLHVD